MVALLSFRILPWILVILVGLWWRFQIFLAVTVSEEVLCICLCDSEPGTYRERAGGGTEGFTFWTPQQWFCHQESKPQELAKCRAVTKRGFTPDTHTKQYLSSLNMTHSDFCFIQNKSEWSAAVRKILDLNLATPVLASPRILLELQDFGSSFYLLHQNLHCNLNKVIWGHITV